MEYKIKRYDKRPDDLSRFVLGTDGVKPLFVVGLNPSRLTTKPQISPLRK